MVGCAATGEALVIDPNRNIQQYLDAQADLTQDEIEWLALYRERSSTDRKQLFTVLRALRDMRSEES